MDTNTITTDDGFIVTSNESIEDMQAATAVEVEPEIAEKPADSKPAEVVTEKPKIDKRTKEGRKASIQEEIDSLAATRHQTQRELEADQARLAQLRAELQDLEARRAPKPAAQPIANDDPKPTLDQFAQDPSGDPLTAWYDALSAWNARKTYRESEAKRIETENRTKQEASLAQQSKQFSERISAATKENPKALDAIRPDILSAKPLAFMAPNERGTFLNAIAQVVLESENPIGLMRHLSETPTDFQRLSTLPPDQFYRAIGQIESKLGVAVAVSGPIVTPVVSSANPPIKPVGSSPVVSDDTAGSDDESFERHFQRENARDPKLRRVKH